MRIATWKRSACSELRQFSWQTFSRDDTCEELNESSRCPRPFDAAIKTAPDWAEVKTLEHQLCLRRVAMESLRRCTRLIDMK